MMEEASRRLYSGGFDKTASLAHIMSSKSATVTFPFSVDESRARTMPQGRREECVLMCHIVHDIGNTLIRNVFLADYRV